MSGETSAQARADALARTRELIRIRRRGRRNIWPPMVLGGSYIAVAGLALTRLEAISAEQIVAGCLLLPVFVLGQRFGLEDDDGTFVMTQSIFVAMLFLVPLAAVPAVILIGIIAGAPRDEAAHHGAVKLVSAAMNGWFCIGPVLVLAVAHEGPPSLDQWPVYVAALGAQFVFDGVVGTVICVTGEGSFAANAKSLVWTDAMDALLASVGLAAVIATGSTLWAIPLASVPIGILILLTRDRQAQVARAVAVTDAFEEVVEQSLVDPLTELANRRKWNDGVEEAEVRRRADATLVVTAVLADVDGLKCVNDSLGHLAGDELIRSAAELFDECAPTDALVARIGGDEFGMLVVHQVATVSAAEIVAAIRHGSSGRRTTAGAAVSMSVGAATCPAAGSVRGAVDLADRRTLEDKRRRKVGRGVASAS